MDTVSEAAPTRASHRGGGWAFGRYHGPIVEPDLQAGWSRFRLKEWHYTAISSPHWFLAIGLVQLGYAAEAFAYLVDRTSGVSLGEWGERSIGGRSLSIAPGPVSGATCWSSRMGEVIKRAVDGTSGWIVRCDFPLADERLTGEIQIVESGPGLSLLHPVADQRPAYTYKATGLRCRASLSLGRRELDFSNALANVDWTRSRALRRTRWNWASASGHTTDGSLVGINLSAYVYDDATGISQENVLRIGAQLIPVGKVNFSIPERPEEQSWSIRGQDSGEVDLRFEPRGIRRNHANLGLVRNELLEPWGIFNGSVSGQIVEPLFGVVERAEALW